MLKLIDNPPILAPDAESLADLDGTWWVAHTKPRFEKSFAWDLNRRGVGYFLPMCEYVILSSGRNRRGMKLLFPSYVFFCGSNEDRYTALTTSRLLQVIDVPDQSGLISQLSSSHVKAPRLFLPSASIPISSWAGNLLDWRDGNLVRLRLSFLALTAVQHNQPDHQKTCQQKGNPESFHFAAHFFSFQRISADSI